MGASPLEKVTCRTGGSGKASPGKDSMGYIFFIVVAFALLGLERLVARGDAHRKPHSKV